MKRLFLSLAFALLAAGCGSSDGGDDGGDFIPTDPSQVDIQATYTDLVVGTGAEATLGRTVSVHYTLWLFDQSKPDFKGVQRDTSIGRGPFEFGPIGAAQVIQGFQAGVMGMKVGGQRRIYVPWQLGYGAAGNAAGGIPPYAALVFEIELLEVK